jgi:phosphohistidine phosphatase
METYLIRHGIAADASPDGSDRQRALTAEGVAKLRGEAAGLNRLEVRLELILSSPLVRARQTADLLARHVDTKPLVVVSSALAPSGSPADVAAELRKHQNAGAIALVGHEPGIGSLAARWLGARASVAFKRGGVCRIDFDASIRDGAGTLRWFATPNMLLLIGRDGRE